MVVGDGNGDADSDQRLAATARLDNSAYLVINAARAASEFIAVGLKYAGSIVIPANAGTHGNGRALAPIGAATGFFRVRGD